MNTNSGIPKNEQAALAERRGYYAHAMKLWGQVVAESKNKSSMWQYAIIRRDFCQSAIKNGYKRPEHRTDKDGLGF